ncbi:oligosaccharide flippase family protein [Geobacillus zalihae]|uniref:Oligosaccharide flippase family protein n=1 Tax=Geobacillus zalihae TaxID=213419 RepID=A0A7H1S004_9BACL|nr:oligosaccharide flippase family protein [Geobacillus zalihae]QNU19843.1 oligosaccharide flippase family protein [Geobacillus zalihae]
MFFPDLITIKTQLQKGWDLFVAQGATTLFSNSNIFIIGLLLTPEQVGLYSIAERIMRTVASMVAPVSNALYPVSAKLFKKSNDVAIKYLKKFLFIGSLVFMLAGVGMVVFSNVIVLVMTGEENIEIQYLLLIMAFIPLSIYINNIYGTQIMLNLYLEKVFKYLIITNGISLPVLSYILTLNFNLWGASFSLLITEILLTVSMVVYVEFIKKQGFLGVLKK